MPAYKYTQKETNADYTVLFLGAIFLLIYVLNTVLFLKT